MTGNAVFAAFYRVMNDLALSVFNGPTWASRYTPTAIICIRTEHPWNLERNLIKAIYCDRQSLTRNLQKNNVDVLIGGLIQRR